MVDHLDGDSTVLGFVEGTAGVAVEGRQGRASHGDTKTRRKLPARNADVLVGIIASLRFHASGFSIFLRPSCMLD